MTLITRTSPPSFSIVDDTTLRQWLRIDADVDAATLDMLLASGSDYLEGLTGRVLAAADYTVEIDTLRPAIPLALFPLNNLSGVLANLADGSTQTLVAGVDYRANLTSNPASIAILSPPPNALSLTVTCNAGYADQASVPAAFQQAAAVLVAAGYDNRSALDPATVTTVGNLVARYVAVGI